jgi:hypothetical protein
LSLPAAAGRAAAIWTLKEVREVALAEHKEPRLLGLAEPEGLKLPAAREDRLGYRKEQPGSPELWVLAVLAALITAVAMVPQ